MIHTAAICAGIVIILILLINNIGKNSSKRSNLPSKRSYNAHPATFNSSPVCSPARNDILDLNQIEKEILSEVNNINIDNKQIKIIQGNNYENCNFYISGSKNKQNTRQISGEVPYEIEDEIEYKLNSTEIMKKMLDKIDKNLLSDKFIKSYLSLSEGKNYKRLKDRM